MLRDSYSQGRCLRSQPPLTLQSEQGAQRVWRPTPSPLWSPHWATGHLLERLNKKHWPYQVLKRTQSNWQSPTLPVGIHNSTATLEVWDFLFLMIIFSNIFIDFREKGSSAFLICPDLQGLNPQPRHVPWLGITPPTFWCTGWCSKQLSLISQGWKFGTFLSSSYHGAQQSYTPTHLP